MGIGHKITLSGEMYVCIIKKIDVAVLRYLTKALDAWLGSIDLNNGVLRDFDNVCCIERHLQSTTARNS